MRLFKKGAHPIGKIAFLAFQACRGATIGNGGLTNCLGKGVSLRPTRGFTTAFRVKPIHVQSKTTPASRLARHVLPPSPAAVIVVVAAATVAAAAAAAIVTSIATDVAAIALTAAIASSK